MEVDVKIRLSCGHRITPDNIYEWNGRKFCRACRRRNQADYMARLRGDPRESMTDAEFFRAV